MKTNILGLLYFVCFTCIAISAFIILFISLRSDIMLSVVISICLLTLGIFGATWASELRRHKKWTWNIGVVILPVSLLLGLVNVATGGYLSQPSYVLYAAITGIALSVFGIYALISEKQLFMATQVLYTQGQSASSKPVHKSLGTKIVMGIVIFLAVVLILLVALAVLTKLGY